jgi:glycosyltransferase involved in cell wall biosynthesis
MDICVCGAQVPFSRGGAELHMDNLVAALRAAGHRADLVRLPVAFDRHRALDSALGWRMVPVDADLVIATNFPSYFVRHRRKVVWLFHQHRNAYDAADMPWSDFALEDGALEDQRLLADWDARVLEEAERVYTTSGVVADRLLRFNGLRATPLYHPPPLHEDLHPGPFGDYVFCATRLEANKRPDLMVEGIANSRSGTRLVIAGTGSLDRDLRALAKRLSAADKVDLTGFVPDEQLVEQYAGALAVLYTPFDEDYGYVTLQAFFAGKPVITTKDAGGVLEWVEDGVTGFVTDGSPAALGEAVDRLANDRALAQRMGETGRERVRGLRWDSVVDQLLSS